MDISDVLIFSGSGVVGFAENPTFVFAGGLAASIGINIQFETVRLSIGRIIFLSMAGYYLGDYLGSKEKK